MEVLSRVIDLTQELRSLRVGAASRQQGENKLYQDTEAPMTEGRQTGEGTMWIDTALYNSIYYPYYITYSIFPYVLV